MALILCPECERQISDKAKVCPHCGNPMGEQAAPLVPTARPDDGTVEERVQGYCAQAENAAASGNGKAALEYVNRALELDIRNSQLWLLKINMIYAAANVTDQIAQEMLAAGRNAVRFAAPDKTEETEYTVASRLLEKSNGLFASAIAGYGDSAYLNQIRVKGYLNGVSGLVGATSGIRVTDMRTLQMYQNLETQALILAENIDIALLERYSELAKRLFITVELERQATVAFERRSALLGFNVKEGIQAQREKVARQIETRARDTYSKADPGGYARMQANEASARQEREGAILRYDEETQRKEETPCKIQSIIGFALGAFSMTYAPFAPFITIMTALMRHPEIGFIAEIIFLSFPIAGYCLSNTAKSHYNKTIFTRLGMIFNTICIILLALALFLMCIPVN